MDEKNLLKEYELLGIAAVGAILILSILISGCVDSGGKLVKEGDNVKANITESNITNTIFIENISAKGKSYPFEKDLIGLNIGEKKILSYEEIISVKLSQEPKANTVYSTPQGAIRVFNVTDTQFYVGQQPLTGETLKFHVTMKNITSKKVNESIKTTVENGDSVEVEYIGTLTNGTKFDSGTINFTVGIKQMINGFDKGVVGMKIGESKDMVIPPEDGYGLPEAIPRVIPQEITIDVFKGAFNNEEPIKGKEYTNLNSLPWPIKVIDVKTRTHNITIEILDAGNFSYSCLEGYGIDKGAVIFYHTDWCPHCQKMKPWVQNLTDEGYKFFSVEAEKEPNKVKIVKECASKEINTGGGIPQFGCPANGKSHIGEFTSIADMKNFAEECNKAA